jgi:hypothetical protein
VDFTLPNDAKHLRACWNDAMLVCEEFPDSVFVKRLDEMIQRYFFSPEIANYPKSKQVKPSFFTKVKQWL